LDQRQVDTGKLRAVSAPLRLRPGDSATLDDGTRVDFLGTRPWTALSVRYDPGERIVLVGAVCLLVGLLASLTGRRRRVFFRVPPEGPVSAGAGRSRAGRRAGRARGARADPARLGAAPRLHRHAGTGRAPGAVGQHVRVRAGRVPGRGDRVASGAVAPSGAAAAGALRHAGA